MLARTTAVMAVAAALLAGCGGGGSAPEAATTTQPTVPKACAAAPTTVDLRAGGDHPAGSERFDATKAVVLRTPVLPGEMAFDGSGLAALQSEAEITPLAIYTLYLSDYAVDRDELTGRGLGVVTPPAGKTLGLVSMVPTSKAGLQEGDVVKPGELGYETNSSLVPLSMQVLSDGNAETMSFTDIEGQAKVLALTDDQMCVDFDVKVTKQGELVYAGSGTVLAPVVRSEPAFFFT